MKKYILIFTMALSLSNQAIGATKNLTEALEKQNFLSAYKNFLLQNKITYDKSKWSNQVIDSMDFTMEAARPNRAYYNNSILWYKTDKITLGFRPVDTTTDCNSGCSPLTFHLVIDSAGKTLAILEEEKNPLKKTMHIPLTKKDKEKLLKLCQELPKKLKYIEHPMELADSNSKFPPQTWTFFQDVLIKGGAYTTFKVTSAAEKTKSYLSPDKKLQAKEEEEKLLVSKLFKKNISGEGDLVDMIGSIQKLALSCKTPFVKRTLFDNFLQGLLYFINKENEGTLSSKQKKLEKLIKEHMNKIDSYLVGSLQAKFYTFLNTLIRTEKGTRFLLLLQNNFKSWKKISENIRMFLPFLADGNSSNKEALKKYKKTIDFEKVLAFSSQNSFFLQSYIKACLALNEDTRTAKAYARLLIRFPKTPYLNEIKIVKTIKDLVEKEKSKELHSYMRNLKRDFALSKEEVPQMTGILPYAKAKDQKKTSPNKADKKQIYIYFAPWCAHCHQLLKNLGETMSSSFWKKTQLVAVFSENKEMLASFIEQTHLKKTAPKALEELIMLENSEETEKLYNEKLFLQAVPKIIVTNKEGKIINFSFAELEPSPEKDLERDVNLILSHF